MDPDPTWRSTSSGRTWASFPSNKQWEKILGGEAEVTASPWGSLEVMDTSSVTRGGMEGYL